MYDCFSCWKAKSDWVVSTATRTETNARELVSVLTLRL